MCESSAFICKNNNELEKVMENVVNIDPCDGKIYLTDLLGEQKIIDGIIKEIRLMDHKIIIQEN
ncbi:MULTISPECIES: CooT family nickel-binding protein [Clostridioides]|uniref:CooT family nickel-binding protein n=1 Tax=unclassified Clostridioides TaxID=2635829 RepID=UPI001D0C603D|nr:CooT family nickel-binding protein [Clostridioides sp. ZZV15-6388]MCC0635952.1 CooT family nickel-binding protein [Clostridioides sp. ES-S-0001-02]MCC0640787.1 CooT family nickel-binding protein [Clostridioides sp. ES-S-0049-03]MCC0644837.1 CooT family nickel-binding protein [Clostridioides sp. ZZV14-6150]MCC0646782.1 CooT family nickel-binding protein [Clostridioides sp. ZZV15-6598]MCC0653329.1 CooT family nickel-binding protein [Clostridioides sp. ES-S-0001-03]MCC0656662.1 CooT family ni